MSDGPSNLERRQKALRAVRRHVRRLEIETHRVKAHLARLEADYEEDVADWMSRTLRRRSSLADLRANEPHDVDRNGDKDNAAFDAAFTGPVRSGAPLVIELDPVKESENRRRKTVTKQAPDSKSPAAPGKSTLNSPIALGHPSASISARTAKRRSVRKKSAPPVMASLAIHAAGLLFCISFGFATVVQQAVPLLASPNALDENAVEELSEVKIEPSKFDDAELQNVVAHSEEFNVADNLFHEFEPVRLGAGSQPLGEIGQLDALPSELGSLMAGAGSPSSGPPGGERGAAVFFGARSHGDRFVFVVDNSSSMKNGRLEAAIAELIRSVEALSPRQAFYVIFVSDQIYPMFYPQAAPDLWLATLPNKKRLAEWLPRAATASGKNRELIKALDMAAKLRPHAVFFLWDGRMDHAGVRQDVMTHMTRPNQWSLALVSRMVGNETTSSQADLAKTARINEKARTFLARA